MANSLLLAFISFLAIVFLTSSEKQQDEPKLIVLKGAQVLVAEKGKWENRTLYVLGQELIDAENARQYNQAETLDVSGQYIIPGLVDGHVHFFQSGGLYTRPDVVDLRHRKSYEEEKNWIAHNIQDIKNRYLACGITHTMDVGGPMHNFTLRHQFDTSTLPLNLKTAGPLISTYQPSALGNDDPPIREVQSIADAEALFHEQLQHQPDMVKVWYIVSKEMPAEKNFPIVKAVGDLCKKHNIPFAVHATQLNTAKLAIKAGANVLVHSVSDSLVDKAFLRAMKKHNVSYIPTLQVMENYQRTFAQDFDWQPHEYRWSNGEMLNTLFDLKTIAEPKMGTRLKMLRKEKYVPAPSDEIMQANLKAVYKAGINIIAGTDAGNIGTQHGASLLRELRMMQASGMSTTDVLKSTTINARRLFPDSQIGSLTAGAPANLVVLNQNPLNDLKALSSISLVMSKGRLIKPHVLFPHTPEKLAQDQLIAYNNRDIEAFLKPYAEDIKAYSLDGSLLFEGKEAMRKRYGEYFTQTPQLHCHLVKRMVMGNTVIDQEKVTGIPNVDLVEAIAIYTIKDEKIAIVRFIRGN